MRAWMLCLAAAVFLPAPSVAASMGNAGNGKNLAERWCASCHLVSAEQTTATTEAPPFATIAERPAEELAKLGAMLSHPHPPMPALDLSRIEIEDLVAYIESLKGSN